MSHVKFHMKMHTEKTSSVITIVQEEEEAVGGLINSDGELEWDPASSGKWKRCYCYMGNCAVSYECQINQVRLLTH